MKMSIEEMIDKGYTMNEILDSVSEIWEKKVAQNEHETKKREAREKIHLRILRELLLA